MSGVAENRCDWSGSTIPWSSSKDTAPQRVAELRGSRLRIGIALPGVPLGDHCEEMLRRAALWNGLRDQIIRMPDDSTIVESVRSGVLDVGFVYRSSASGGSFDELPVDPSWQPDVRHPVAILRSTKNATLSERFLEFLIAPEATAIFSRHGFTSMSTL